MDYVICFSFQRVKCTLVCKDEQSFTDICALLFRTLNVLWSVYILQLSAIAHLKAKFAEWMTCNVQTPHQLCSIWPRTVFFLSVSTYFLGFQLCIQY